MRLFRRSQTRRLRRLPRPPSRRASTLKPFPLEKLESRQLLAAVPFGEPEVIDDLDADGPASIAMADIDADGDADAVVSSFRDGRVAWYENDGDGRFARHHIASVEADDVTRVLEVLAADLDGDGDQDVALAAYGADRIMWYENVDGQGGFEDGLVVTTETDGVRTLDAADLDGDGDIDLVSGSWFDDKVAWYENEGGGNFGAQQVITTDTDGPRHLRIGDIDGDTQPDIVLTSRLDDAVSWIKNQGGGTFGSPRALPTNNNGPEGLALSDADGDGDLDVFVASRFDNMIAWFENMGDGNFGGQQTVSTTAQEAQFVALADLDGDGDNDLISSSYDSLDIELDKVVWYPNTDGAGNFGPERNITADLFGAQSLAIADINKDGDADVFAASIFDNRVSWFDNDGTGRFGFPNQVLSDASGAGSVTPADVDGDGDLDIVATGSSDNEVAWYENTDGKGNFGLQTVISNQAAQVQQVRAADLDGDGDADVLSASYGDGKIAWYENTDGKGTFGPQTVIERLSGAISVHAADVDGDGDLDVLSASALDSIVAWYENTDARGTFGPIQILTRRAIGAEWVSTGDVDGDGDADVISASYGDGKVSWYENENGQATFGAANTISTGGGTTAVEAMDVDGDGDMDLVATQYELARLVWFENEDGSGAFGDAQVVAQGLEKVEALSIVDVDGDGALDILSSAYQGNQAIVWFERIEDGFDAHPLPGRVNGVYDLAGADMDGDGDTDLLAAPALDSTILLLRNQGSRGDFDGDGSVDQADIDLLCQAMSNQPGALFDLNGDGLVDLGDLDALINDVLKTTFGDANLDGVFNSADLVLVFRAGHYEDGDADNSSWSEGDWNCDGEFDSSDLVAAFRAGGYEANAAPNHVLPHATDLAAAILWEGEKRKARGQVPF